MSQKTVQSAKNSLKFKASPREGVLEVRIGVRKFSLPVEARMLSNGDFLFLSFPATSELFRIDGKTLTAMDGEADATEAYGALNPGRKRGRRSASNDAELPSELAEALKNLPAGYRLGYGPDNTPKLVRTRQRRKKA